MIIDFDKMETTVLKNFYDGNGDTLAKLHADEHGKILRVTLVPGASIGMHTHNGTGEIIYVLDGCARIVCDGNEEIHSAGSCHYCPEGHSHSMEPYGDKELTVLAVVPKYSEN